MPHDKDTCSPTCTWRAPPRSTGRSPPRAEAWEDWHRMPVGGARRGLPPRSRAARRALARDARRRDDAEPVEDGAPGRDRRRLRGDRLLALQRRVHDPHLQGAAELLARRLEPDGVPAARGLRLRDQPIQLHGDRRNLLDAPRADGRHRRSGSPRRPPPSPPTGCCDCSRRPACRRGDQLRLPGAAPRRRPRPGERAPRRGPLHRLDRGLPLDVEDGRLERRQLPQLPADRRRDRRQGLHRRPPLRRRRTRSRRRSSAARSSTRDRSARPPRVSTPLEPLAGAARAARRGGRQLTMGDVSDFSNFMGAVIDGNSFARSARRSSRRRATTPRWWSAAAPRTTKVSSSSRR